MRRSENNLQDEYIEAVWILRERGGHTAADLRSYFGESFDEKVLANLVEEGMLSQDESSDRVIFTESGENRGRLLIRAHRLAERLLFDVLHIEDYELAACEFEHILDTDLIDSICTLLGHPRRCPDGLPIPEGECCKAERKTIRTASVSLLELEPDDSGRVIAVNAESDHQLHLLDLLQIRPGTILRLHQKYPSIVVECDGSNIALDEEVAGCIYLWKMNSAESSDLLHHHRHPHHREHRGRGRSQQYDCGPGPLYGKERRPRWRRFLGQSGNSQKE